MPVASLDALLENIPGIDIRQRGINNTQADISIRGGTFDQTLVLLNGVNISDPQTGHHNFNIPIDPAWIEKIEILRGPAARVFGPNAFNGVVNIISKAPGPDHIEIATSGGDYGTYKGSVSSNLKIKQFCNFLAFSNSKSDGFTANTDYRIQNGFFASQWNPQKVLVSLNAGITSKNFGANSFYSPKYPDQFEKTKTLFGSLKATFGKSVIFTPSVYWRRNYDKFLLFRNESPSWYKTHNYHRTDVFGITFPVSFSGKLGITAMGFDVRKELIYSNVLGYQIVTPVPVPDESDAFYSKSASREICNLYAEHSVYLGKLYVSAGFLYGYNSGLKAWHLYPGLDVNYQLYKFLVFHTSVSKTLRLPTFTDLFYTSPTNTGNPDLKPEEAISAEFGIKLQKQGYQVDACGFMSFGTNMIDWVKPAGEEKWQSVNLTEVNTKGIETSILVKPEVFFGTAYRFQTIKLAYTYLWSDKNSGKFISKYVLDGLRHKLSVNLRHKIIRNFNAGWVFGYQLRNGTYLDFNAGNIEKEYKPVVLIDLRIDYTKAALKVYADITNMLSNEYFDQANVPQPGRLFSIGILYRLYLSRYNQDGLLKKM